MSSPSEHIEQREFIRWFRRQYPGVTIFAIPNGGGRSKAQAVKLKAEGVTPGVWDLFWPSAQMWIEFKRSDSGRLSPEQREFGRTMLSLGYRCMVAWGCNDAIEQLLHGERESWARPKKSALYAPFMRQTYRKKPAPDQ